MRRLILALAIGVAGCNLTPAQIQGGIAVARTLADVAAQYNTTAASLVAKGNLICGKADSATGQLIADSARAVLNAAGAPAAVTDALPGDVAAACPTGTQPGPLPDGLAAELVPVVATAAAAVLPRAVGP